MASIGDMLAQQSGQTQYSAQMDMGNTLISGGQRAAQRAARVCDAILQPAAHALGPTLHQATRTLCTATPAGSAPPPL